MRGYVTSFYWARERRFYLLPALLKTTNEKLPTHKSQKSLALLFSFIFLAFLLLLFHFEELLEESDPQDVGDLSVRSFAENLRKFKFFWHL